MINELQDFRGACCPATTVVSPAAPASLEKRTQVRYANNDDKQKLKSGQTTERSTVDLLEENARHVDVYVEKQKEKSDEQITEHFLKYVLVEYIFRLEESVLYNEGGYHQGPNRRNAHQISR